MSAYPPGTVAADLDPVIRDGDDDSAYEQFMSRVDDGLACGLCMHEAKMLRSVVLGVPLLTCPHCGCESVDCAETA